MIICANTNMMLFRFSNYKDHNFIDEHKSVLRTKEHVWMLKLGKKANPQIIKKIRQDGGWIILRTPKVDGSKCYLAHFTTTRETPPEDKCFPTYYQELLDDQNIRFVYMEHSAQQWFRLTSIQLLDHQSVSSLITSKTSKNVEDLIKTTRTAVMYVKNSAPIVLEDK